MAVDRRFGWWVVALASVWLAACGDEECTRLCPSPLVCVNSGGEELCLEPNCGGAVCVAGETCVSGVCRADTGCTGCTASEHCVSGQCVANYTASNVCDPLRECREGCSTSAACVQACETDRSVQCATCAGELSQCESREGCRSQGPGSDCCDATFCSCFPTFPGCNGVPACLGCQEECGEDASCFASCRSRTLACNVCLQPFDTCAAAASARECVDEFCACLDPSETADCR